MFSQNRRLLAVFTASITPILAALWATFLSKLTAWEWPYIYVGAICIAAGTAAYFVHLKPARDLEQPVRQFLKVLSDKPIKLGNRYQIKPRLNIMVIRRPWYMFFRRHLVVVWGVNMDSSLDVRFKCRINQGVASEAVREGVPVLKGCEGVPRDKFGFSKKQARQTRHVTAVWSWPIFELDKDNRGTGHIVGVLNLDTTASGAEARLIAHSQEFEESLQTLTEVASKIV